MFIFLCNISQNERIFMNILDNLKVLQNIKTLDDLKKEYDFEKLSDLRILVTKLLKETDIEFKKELNKSYISKDILFKLWNSKSNLEKLNELVFKAMSAFEREDLINKTSILTEKLSNIVQNMENTD